MNDTHNTSDTDKAEKAQSEHGANHLYRLQLMADFARKLERERDEACEELAKIKIERGELWQEIAAAKHGDSGYAVLQERHEKQLTEKDAQIQAMREVVKSCMSAMPVGNIKTHIPENLAARIGDLASALAIESSENEAMREAIKEAHDAIEEAREVAYHEVCNWRAVNINLPKSQDALTKLKPFLP